MITRKELIKKYIEFFKAKKHREIANSSLIPENAPTVLFTTAVMHPLVPFLLGQPHPLGKRLVNVQRCIRTGDIEEVGDTYHHTFFEMLGNWSLGDYFKEDAIKMSFEFLTKVLKIPKEKITVTCFKGDKNVPKDTEASDIWKSLGIDKIKFLGREDNWWETPGPGPCGPDTEMFINDLEIWNDVFMQYKKDEKGKYLPATQKNVDTGMGVERTIAILNKLDDNYLTEVWQPIIKEIEKISKKKYSNKENQKAMRIIADHIKAAVFIIGDGISPGNTEQGYVLRRLIRRAIRYGKFLMMQDNFTKKVAEPVFNIYSDYPTIKENKKTILEELEKEENRFRQTLAAGLRFFNKSLQNKKAIKEDKFSELMKDPNKAILIGRIFDLKKKKKDYSLKKPRISKGEIDKASLEGRETFLLYQSYGFPLELIDELAMAKGFLVDHYGFRDALKKHQELSRTAAAGRFKSGLADKSEETTKLHTAAHLLLRALQIILKDENISQKGSNITPERLRLDFSFPRKLTQKERQEVEDLVNAEIEACSEVVREEMPPEEAKAKGAKGVFDKKYGKIVSVYNIGDFSKEICAGPHAKTTGELGKFKIKKETSSSSGVRRIKAILE